MYMYSNLLTKQTKIENIFRLFLHLYYDRIRSRYTTTATLDCYASESFDRPMYLIYL